MIEDQRTARSLLLVMVWALVLFALLGVVVAVATVAREGEGTVEAMLVLALSVVLLMTLSWGAIVMSRRSGPVLVVSSEGVQREEGRAVVKIAWTDVSTVWVGDQTHDLSIGLLSSATADDLIIGGTTINADPALVVQLLTFYASHEQARPELGTEASLQRVQAGRFDV